MCSFWVEHDYKVKLDTVVQVVNSFFFCFEHNLSECNVIKKLFLCFSSTYIKLWMHLGGLENTQKAIL